MLSNGIFNHLPDDEVSKLYHLVAEADETSSIKLLGKLVSYWYRGEFFSTNVSPKFLQECNEHLQRIGQPMIETYYEAVDEA